jgi:hypothetical protein
MCVFLASGIVELSTSDRILTSYAIDSYHSPGCHTRCQQDGEGEKTCRRMPRLSEQDAKAFLREMVIVCQDVREALAAHDVHGDAIREAVVLIEMGFVER